jgi:hypothetical protein
MGSAFTDVIVHVNEALSEEAILSIERDVRTDDGVISVGHRPGQSHLMMVVYDPDVAPAASLLHSFQDRGLHAQLVGF